MRNPIVKSVFIVFCFWYVILYLMSAASIKDLPDNIFFVMSRVIPGLLVGVALYFLWDFLKAGNLARTVQGVQLRGAKSEVGDILQPGFAEPVPRGVIPDVFWDEFPWWKAYEARYPHHAAFFRAAAAVMFAQPRMPASPVPGGHANSTLIAHSVRVAHKVLATAPNWKYVGHKNKRGEITFPLFNKEAKPHVFAVDTATGAYEKAKFDPILPLIGFVHDIGKMVCYKNQTPTTMMTRLVALFKKPDHFEWKKPPFTVTVNKREHDSAGAKLLRNIPELFNLPMAERDALIIAVGHYHHINSLSHAGWITDRMRSLVHLLYRSDVATGQDEGDLSSMAYEQDIELAEVATKVENEPPTQATAIKEKSKQPSSSELNSVTDWAIINAQQIIYKPNRINGKTSASSCGYKVGKWVYLYDKKLRELLADDEAQPNLKIPPEPGELHVFTKELLAQLQRNGWTYNSFNGTTNQTDECLWDIAFEKKAGDMAHHHSILIASIEAFPELAFLPDAQAITVEIPHNGGHLGKSQDEQPPVTPPIPAPTPALSPSPEPVAEQKSVAAPVENVNPSPSKPAATAIQPPPKPLTEAAHTTNPTPALSPNENTDDPLKNLVKDIKQVLTAKKLREAEQNMTIPFKTDKGVAYFKATDLSEMFEFDGNNLPPDVKMIIGSVTQEQFLRQTLPKTAAPVKKY